MKLTIYTDETYTEKREVRERDRMKIPYRVGQYVINAIADVDTTNNREILDKVLQSEEQLTAVVRATFGLTDDDLDHVDMVELVELGQSIMQFVVGKINELGAGESDPNAQTPAKVKA